MALETHYTTAEVAEKLHCSKDTILRLAQRGDLRSTFVASERRYPESGITEYLQRSENRAAPAPVVRLSETRPSPTRRTA